MCRRTGRFPPVLDEFGSDLNPISSSQIQLQLFSPSLKVYEDGRGPVAVFSGHDQVEGRVTLDNDSYHSGRLSVSVHSYSSIIRSDCVLIIRRLKALSRINFRKPVMTHHQALPPKHFKNTSFYLLPQWCQ